MRLGGNTMFNTHDVKMMLLTRQQLRFIHLTEHNLRHDVLDPTDPTCSIVLSPQRFEFLKLFKGFTRVRKSYPKGN